MRTQDGVVDRKSSEPGKGDRTVMAGAAAMVLAVVCCAAGPALVAVLGGAALGSLSGWATGILALVVAVGVLVVRTRRRRGKPSPTSPKQVLR